MVYPNLPGAPITEALIQFRVIPSGVTLECLRDDVSQAWRSEYSERKDLISWEGEFRPTAEQSLVRESKSTHGYVFWSRDKLHAIQAKLDAFTCSRLRPYLGWTQLRDETRQRWLQYSAITKPLTITRVAVRSINRIELPLPVTDFDAYFNMFPRIPSGLPQALAGLFMRLVLQADQAHAVITLAIAETGTPSKLPIILDIDTWLDRQMAVDGEDAWQALEDLHRLKNDIFFKSLTQTTVDMFS